MFITFEGPEGSGKTTQIGALALRLRQAGRSVTVTEEPGGTRLGLKVRQLVKETKDAAISPATELFLFAASRSQLIAEVVKPALAAGRVVLCDRYAESTLAYQGYGRGLSLNLISAVNAIATEGIRPDLIVLLDLPPELGLERKKGEGWDRFQAEDLAFHRRVRQGYLEMAASEPDRWLVLDATACAEAVGALIWQRVAELRRGDKRRDQDGRSGLDIKNSEGMQ
ncbi:MAG: dTMP kinase [Chloroflexi bacterium]|nr:dTMP kinase [Chloroflexota bacterium]